MIDTIDGDHLKHRCTIWDIVKISETQIIYLCAICKKKVAISDKEIYGLDMITLIDLSGQKIYPNKEQREVTEENLEEWK
jgi:hypothetical protein